MDDLQMKKLNTQLMMCQGCGFLYNPKRGDEESNVSPYTNFAELPTDWVCPICDKTKDQFVPYQLDILPTAVVSQSV